MMRALYLASVILLLGIFFLLPVKMHPTCPDLGFFDIVNISPLFLLSMNGYVFVLSLLLLYLCLFVSRKAVKVYATSITSLKAFRPRCKLNHGNVTQCSVKVSFSSLILCYGYLP